MCRDLGWIHEQAGDPGDAWLLVDDLLTRTELDPGGVVEGRSHSTTEPQTVGVDYPRRQAIRTQETVKIIEPQHTRQTGASADGTGHCWNLAGMVGNKQRPVSKNLVQHIRRRPRFPGA